MRYHIGKVYRGERAQIKKGRLREFYQADIDIVGVDTVESDILAILTGVSALERVGIPKSALNSTTSFFSKAKLEKSNSQINSLIISNIFS